MRPRWHRTAREDRGLTYAPIWVPHGDDPAMWALAFVAPQFARNHDSRELVADLLRVAAGRSVSSTRTLSSAELVALVDHRVLGLIPPTWSVDAVEDDLRTRLRSIAMAQLNLQAALAEILELLNSSRFECRVLKGLATSQLDYPRSGLRHTGDVDLLVRPDELPSIIDLLLRHGCVHHSPSHTDADLGKGTTLVHRRRVQVDLHSRLNRFCPQNIETLLRDPVKIPGTPGLALPLERRLIHAASHLCYTPPGSRRLSGLADVSAIVDRHELDWDDLRATASELNVESLTGLGLWIEALLLNRDTSHLDAWKPPTFFERRSYARTDRALIMEHVLALQGLDGLDARLRYLRQWSLPSREVLRARGGARVFYGKMLPKRLGGQQTGKPGEPRSGRSSQRR